MLLGFHCVNDVIAFVQREHSAPAARCVRETQSSPAPLRTPRMRRSWLGCPTAWPFLLACQTGCSPLLWKTGDFFVHQSFCVSGSCVSFSVHLCLSRCCVSFYVHLCLSRCWVSFFVHLCVTVCVSLSFVSFSVHLCLSRCCVSFFVHLCVTVCVSLSFMSFSVHLCLSCCCVSFFVHLCVTVCVSLSCVSVFVHLCLSHSSVSLILACGSICLWFVWSDGKKLLFFRSYFRSFLFCLFGTGCLDCIISALSFSQLLWFVYFFHRPYLETLFNALECTENDYSALFALCLLYAMGQNEGMGAFLCSKTHTHTHTHTFTHTHTYS